jgi:general secretion pathway protein K
LRNSLYRRDGVDGREQNPVVTGGGGGDASPALLRHGRTCCGHQLLGGPHDRQAGSRGERDGESGIALIAVLWVMVVLAALAASFSTSTRTQVNLARNMVAAAEAEAIADAGIARAAAGLVLTVRQGGLRADGTIYAWQFADGEARFFIGDEGGKIDVNVASRTLLHDLLEVVGAGRDADLLADAIVAHRSGGASAAGQPGQGETAGGEDEAEFANGAEGAAPFALVAELQRVPGMTGQIYRLAAPALTVYGDQPEPDARAAPPVVREALARRQNRRQAEPLGPAESEEAEAVPPEGPLSILAEGTFARRSSLGVFTIHCEGRSRGGAIFVREAVIAGDYGGGNPFSIRAWNQGRRMLFPRPGEAEPIF